MSFASYNQVARKCELAFERVILAMESGTLKTIPILRRFAGTDITGPTLLIFCRRMAESCADAEPTDMWDVEMEFAIRSHYKAEDGSAYDERQDELAGQLVDLLKGPDALVTALNTVMADEDFTALAWRKPLSIENSTEEKHYVTTVRAVLVMCPNKLAA